VSRAGAFVRAVRLRLGPSRIPLDRIEPRSITSNQPDAGAAVRWIAPVTIGHVRRAALLCHPESSLTYTLDAPAKASLVVWCGLQPESWPENVGGARFTLTVKTAGVERSDSIVLDPGRRPADRRWRRLRVPFPAGGASEAVVTLATTVPPGASPAKAWAVWGDPHVVWSRPVSARAASVVGAVRLLGVAGAVRRLMQLAARPESSGSYRAWVASHALGQAGLERLRREVAALPLQPLVTVIVPVFNTPPTWLLRAVDSVKRQVYSRWHLSICDDGSTDEGTRGVLARLSGDERITIHRLPENRGISAASNAALANARGEWIALLDHDDELAPEALAELVKTLNRNPDADIVYSDEDKLDPAGERCDPFFKPDWAPEHLLSCMYIGHLFAARKALVEKIGGFRVGYEGSQDYDLMLRLVERTSRIEHISKVLYHWRKSPSSAAGSGLAKPWAIDAGHRALTDHAQRNGLDAEVLRGPSPGRYRVRRRVPDDVTVSAIVGAFAPASSAHACAPIVSQLTAEAGPERLAEVILVLREPASESGPVGESVRVVHASAGTPVLRAVTDAAMRARGQHLLFIAPEMVPRTSDWLEALIEHSMNDAVAAVGAKLLDPEGRLRHIGIVMGLKGIAGSPYAGYPGSTEGYVSSAVGTRNYSAVSGDCLMTRRDVFVALGGFDERAGQAYAAMDYCLRAHSAGYRVVFTPYACLTDASSSAVEDSASAEYMRARWAKLIDDDRYFNPNLSRDFLDCRPRL
jgi:GT2 family glycosyltransferase